MSSRLRLTALQGVPLLFAFSVVCLLSACQSRPLAEEPVVEKPIANVVQLSPEAFKAAAFSVVTVQAKTVSIPFLSTAVVRADQNAVFHINSFVSGRIQQDRVSLGDTVHAGQVLAVVQNLDVAKIQGNFIHELHSNEVEIAQAKTRYRLAKNNLIRERQLYQEGISPKQDYQEAQAAEELAKTQLAGSLEHETHIKSEAQALLSAYGEKPNSSHSERINTFTRIVSPRNGVVLQKNITQGDMITPDTVIYEVADLSKVWLDVTVYPKDIALLHPGQPLVFTTDSLPGKQFVGRIDYIQPTLQESSQTYIARAYLQNPGGVLRPGIFGQVRIARYLSRQEVVVPQSAVQRYGRETFVFIPESGNRFRKQTVRLGEPVQDGFIIQEGLQPGLRVVSQGSFFLKAELLKSLSEEAD